MEQKNKVVKLNENPMGNEEEIDKSGDELSDMDKLPNEILMKILDYLDEQQLVKCRILSSRWNEISCLLLQDKTQINLDSKLVVQLKRVYGQNYFRCQTVIEKALGAFIKDFSQSTVQKSSNYRRPFPFSRFDVQDFSRLRESQMIQLISTFGPHMKSVTLNIKEEDCDNFKNFWKLLLEFAPHIQHLGISGGSWLNDLNLFDSDSDQENGPSLLLNLKSIKVTRDNDFDEFMKELLNHAPNVKEVMSNNFPRNSVQGLEDFAFWQRLENSHLIKKFELISFDASKNYLPPADLMKNVRLNYLSADCSMYSMQIEKGISYVAHAIKSSQDSLSSLKLDNLTSEKMNRCLNDISSLPNVQKLQIQMMPGSDEEEIVNVLTRFSQLCPNITSLIINGLHGKFLRIAPILWNQFKGLKFLKFPLYVEFDDGTHDLLSLTSGFSGYSKDSLEIIQDKLDQGISLEEAIRDEPQEPSIFDLKDLSRLEVECLFLIRKYGMQFGRKQVEKSLLRKMLPQHIRENPRTFEYKGATTFDPEVDHECECCTHCCGCTHSCSCCSDEEYYYDSDLE